MKKRLITSAAWIVCIIGILLIGPLFLKHDPYKTNIVMKQGKIVEEGSTKAVLDSPLDDYTKLLVDCH